MQKINSKKRLNTQLVASRYSLVANYGFTMIEIMVVLGIFGFIASSGLIIGMDAYQNYLLDSERDTIVSLLERARNNSMNNIDQKEHRIHFTASGYVILPSGEVVGRSPGITATEFPLDANPDDFTIIFEQLSGSTPIFQIDVSNGTKTKIISINSEGRINW